MDLNLYSNDMTVRLSAGKRRKSFPDRLPELKGILEINGIKNVIITCGRDIQYNIDMMSLVMDKFNVWLECDPGDYLLYSKAVKEISPRRATVMPGFRLDGEGISGFRLFMKNTDFDMELSVFIKTDKKNNEDGKTVLREMMLIAGERPVTFYWDCGLLFCDFNDEELLGYFIEKGSMMRFYCAPVMNIDTGFKMSFCPSLKLRGMDILKNSLFMEKSGKALKKLDSYWNFGIFGKCSSCPNFLKVCSGGCKAAVKESFQN